MTRSQADAVVIGGGIMGCGIARELARRGMDVTVLERGSPGRAAVWAAAGMLSPLGVASVSGAFLDLADESLKRYAAWTRALRDESGIDPEYRDNGMVHVSLGDLDDELDALAASPAASRFGVSELDAREAREAVPGLSDTVTRALLIERDARVNNRLLAQAAHASAGAAGAAVRAMKPVSGILEQGGAVTGVRLASGETFRAPIVIIAAGAWSGAVEGLPRELPVRPVKGQMFAVDGLRTRGMPELARSTRTLTRAVLSRSCYIVPREDGRLLVGATVEDVGFDDGPTPRGIAGLMAAATRLIPFIEDLPLVETWSGFRPATPDYLPILGSDPHVRGLFYATGHYRNGILLAPITAECIAAIVCDEDPPVPVDAFAIERFDGVRADAVRHRSASGTTR